MAHEVTGWALEHGFALRGVSRSRSPRSRTSTSTSRAASEGRGVSAVPPAAPVHEQGLLAQPRVGLLHVRVPADVPGDLHGAARRRRRHVCSGTDIKQSTYYVVAMAAFGVISACYTNIAISTVFTRDAGILKRLRGTPLPAARLPERRGCCTRWWSAFCWSRSRVVFGAVAYSADIPTGTPLLEFVLTFLVGALRSRPSALAVTGDRAERRRGPADRERDILPLLFLSGIFIPSVTTPPAWMTSIGRRVPGEALRRRDAGLLPGRVRATGAGRPITRSPSW